ncbi:MAG: tetratricopeptide repeat protein [Acidiferrobacterales bacterium]
MLNYRDLIHSVASLIAAASLLSSPLVHASEQSDASIQQGIQAYNAGEYQKALDYFSQAVRHGATQAALYYDIGVAHYKLAQYEEADKAFQKVAQSPEWEALALYNRALIAYRTGQPELARQLVTISVRLSKSPGLTALNFRLLDKLENKPREKPGWSSLMRFGLGYNDNVLLTDAGASVISGKGDAFLDFTGRMQRSFSLKDSNKLKFFAQANLRNYAKLNEYDQTGLRGGFEKELGRPNSAVGAYLEQVFLDGKSYELVSSLEYKRPLTNGRNNPLVLKYSFSNYSMLDNTYAYLGGVRHRIRLAKNKKFERGAIETYLRAEYNDREDQTLGADFYSFSPVRVGIGTSYTRNLSPRRLFSGSLFLQQSRFLDQDVRSGVAKTREDGLLEMRLNLIHVSSSKWIYRASYIGTINNSNYSEFTYNQNIVSFDIFKSF